MDPKAEKFYGMSPYTYCAGNPVNLVDDDGKRPRLYVQTKSFGHAFITSGEGPETTVYTYGRYGLLYPVSFNITLGKYNPTGEGVFGILKGEKACEYLRELYNEGSFDIYEFPGIDDSNVDEYFTGLFSQYTELPSNSQKSTYLDNDYRVIGDYHILFNNCVTFSRDALHQFKVDIESSTPVPQIFNHDVMRQSVEDASINVIYNPKNFLNYLLKEFWYEGTY